MSGLEIIGLAASVLQIADYGWKTSYKLYAFSKKVHEAGKTIELISQDISATGAVLKQLGDVVEKDVTAAPDNRICSQGLIIAASQLVEDCKNLFTEIDNSIGGKEGNKVILGFKQKLKWSYLEPQIEQLRANLERLKSTLAIMLNVLIYAEQLRSREERAVLTEQQVLIASFATQKSDAEKSIDQLNRSIKNGLRLDDESKATKSKGTQALAVLPRSGDANLGACQTAMAEDTVLQSSMQPTMEFNGPEPVQSINGDQKFSVNAINMFSLPQSKSVAGMAASTTLESGSPPLSGLPHLEQHRLLIEKILEEVNSSRYAIDHGLRYRLHDGILDLHWEEWSPLRSQYGDNALSALLTHSPVLARHWYERLLKESNNKKRKDKESDSRLANNHTRPMYIRVHTKYLSSATLEHYGLRWEYDRQDPDHIIIKEYINPELQEDLFNHTKNLKDRELPLSQEAMSAEISSSKTRSQKQPMLKPFSDMELEYLDPDDVIKANHTPVFEAVRPRSPYEETLPPLILEDEPESSVVSDTGRSRSRGKRRLGRTRPSQSDAVLIRALKPNRPEGAAHTGECALDSGSQSEAQPTSSKDHELSQTTAHDMMDMAVKPTDELKGRVVLSPETLSHDLRTRRTSHKIAEQGQRSRINTALKEIKALLPEEIIVEGNHAKNGLSVPGASKASTVEMAIAYIKILQTELESSCQHFLCNIPGCCKAFRRPDLLQRHLERHDLETSEEASSYRRQSNLKSISSHAMYMPSEIPSLSTMSAGDPASTLQEIRDEARDIMWSGSKADVSEQEMIAPRKITERDRKEKSSGSRIGDRSFNGDVAQRYSKRQKRRQGVPNLNSDEALRREHETTDLAGTPCPQPEPGTAAAVANSFLAQWTNISPATVQ